MTIDRTPPPGLHASEMGHPMGQADLGGHPMSHTLQAVTGAEISMTGLGFLY